MIKTINIILITFLSVIYAYGQTDSVKLVKYGPGFRFSDGIYLDHNQLLNNNPIPKKRIVTEINRTDFDFFSKLINQNKIEYYDEFGIRRTIAVNDLWGFCNRGTIYINWGNEFCRIPVVGAICHFVANITIYDDRYYTPFYGYNYYATPAQTSHSEIQQFIMDFKLGKVRLYDVENLTDMIRSDSLLYNEFINLKSRKQNDLKFLYLRKFNEKYPLYIPVH
jgi:hypothetical protein